MVLGESASSWESVLSGVPQGSVFGPLLFVIYINDLTDSVNNKLKLYADDSKILSTVNSWKDALGVQKDIDSISEWMKDERMQLNTNKCKVIHFGKNNSNFPYLNVASWPILSKYSEVSAL